MYKQIFNSCFIFTNGCFIFYLALTFYFWLAVVGALQEFRERETQVVPEEIKHPYPAEDSLVIQD